MSTAEITKRVFNPVTGKYYSITERSSAYTKPGEIRGLWSPTIQESGESFSCPEDGKTRVYNPVTGRYYEIHQHSSKYTEPGQIKGLWHNQKKRS
jgi:hypothetical protein